MDLLYAQARVYDRVKNWNRLNFLFSIIVPLLRKRQRSTVLTLIYW